MTDFVKIMKISTALSVVAFSASPFTSKAAQAQSFIDGQRYDNECLYKVAKRNPGIDDASYIVRVQSECPIWVGAENPSPPLAPPITTVGSLNGIVCTNCVSVPPSRIKWVAR
ncbi:MAG: hypothetical protein PGN16_10625 [Sphingomonas phyllosphaerae]|uniref:hypothetical protein n=1 Tax=Sphingomonas phyllosphaerae TaxID=257003 RepID=UPI002FF9E430